VRIDISVIVPIYKGQKHIKRLMEMILSWNSLSDRYSTEIILVNDYPDIPLDISYLQSEGHIQRKIIENLKNIGIHGSRIEGIKHAEGKYILFLDQDDTLMNSYLESQMNCLRDNDAVICGGLWRNGEKIYSETNPMKEEYSFEEYLDCGYPLVSLGQLLIKKSSIPTEWIENPMIYNGWDDHFLWAVMMAYGVKVAVNEEILYIHEEDGNNASFNWKQMSLSGQNFRDVFLSLNLLKLNQKNKFISLINNKIRKYDVYAELSVLMDEANSDMIATLFANQGVKQIAIYGFGIYGKKLFELLQNTDIHILYGIDQRNDTKTAVVPIYGLKDELENVDAVIITAVFSFEEIKRNLEKYFMKDLKIISLLDLLKMI